METMTSFFSEICNTGITSITEELPYWSTPSGLEIMNSVQLKPNLKVLDTGSGSGYQMIELAQRLGNSSMVFGMEQEDEILERIIQISEKYQLNNIEAIKGNIDRLPFGDHYFDLIVSNIGIRNIDNFDLFFEECKRVAKPTAQLIISLHLQDAIMEFYNAMEEVLKSQNMLYEIETMKEHIHSRYKSLKSVEHILHSAGFLISEIKLHKFSMTFLDGTTFFNHRLIRNVFLPEWTTLFEKKVHKDIFKAIELKINHLSSSANGFKISVPYAVLNCICT
ncbi:class I SAM-dependent methyltransferase [Bacteroidota bacterium]